MELIGSKLCKVSDIGVGEYMYGGRLLELLAEQGAVYAMKRTGESHMVGYRFDAVVISRPVRAGEIVDFYGAEPETRNSSLTFTLTAKVGAEQVLSGRCTFVAIDAAGRKKPLDREKFRC